MDLQQSTAAHVSLFMGNASSPTQGLAGLTVNVTISKAGGAFAAAGATVTDRGNGLYVANLTTTDTNTLGLLVIRGNATGAADFFNEHRVVAHDPGADIEKIRAAAYDTITRSGGVLTLSTGATQTISTSGRETAE